MSRRVLRFAISAVIGGLLAVRDNVFSLPLLILVALGLILAHTGSNLVNDFWDFRHGSRRNASASRTCSSRVPHSTIGLMSQMLTSSSMNRLASDEKL